MRASACLVEIPHQAPINIVTQNISTCAWQFQTPNRPGVTVWLCLCFSTETHGGERHSRQLENGNFLSESEWDKGPESRGIGALTAIDATAGERRKKIAASDLRPTDGNRNGTPDQMGSPATYEQPHSLPKSSQAVVAAKLESGKRQPWCG